jgi:hypothetical protein
LALKNPVLCFQQSVGFVRNIFHFSVAGPAARTLQPTAGFTRDLSGGMKPPLPLSAHPGISAMANTPTSDSIRRRKASKGIEHYERSEQTEQCLQKAGDRNHQMCGLKLGISDQLWIVTFHRGGRTVQRGENFRYAVDFGQSGTS